MLIHFLYIKIFFVILYGFSSYVAHEQQEIGDICQNEEQKTPGKCVLLEHCPEGLELIKQNKYPQVCKFQNKVPVVCCTNATHRIPGKISEQKCWEYGEAVYKKEYSATLGISKKKKMPLLNVSTCVQDASPFIHGGKNAKAKEFPHMALLGYGEPNKIEWRCGGALISNEFVLTAAHCLYSLQFGRLRWVRLGDLNITSSTDDANPEEFHTIEHFKKPGFKRPAHYHDIALVKLDHPVKFSEYIRPACLHHTFEVPSDRYIATGWGWRHQGADVLSDFLQKVSLELYTHAECNSLYKPDNLQLKDGILPDKQLCVGMKNSDKDTCPGDSGGPLQIYHPKVHCMYSIVGVTSFGQSVCGVSGFPGVYTRVSEYIEWIENTVWP